jgi:hypothetical protein
MGHGGYGPLTRRGTSSKAACKVCGQWLSSELGGQAEKGPGRTAVIASLGRIGQPAIGHYALLTGGQLERVPNAAKVQKSRSWRAKSHASLSFVVPWDTGAKNQAHRSARHIDAERTAAVMNAPKEDRRRTGKRACSPVKEL